MKKFEILWKLSKYDTETQSEQMLLENGTKRLTWMRAAINFKFAKNTISASTVQQSPTKWGKPVHTKEIQWINLLC